MNDNKRLIINIMKRSHIWQNKKQRFKSLLNDKEYIELKNGDSLLKFQTDLVSRAEKILENDLVYQSKLKSYQEKWRDGGKALAGDETLLSSDKRIADMQKKSMELKEEIDLLLQKSGKTLLNFLKNRYDKKRYDATNENSKIASTLFKENNDDKKDLFEIELKAISDALALEREEGANYQNAMLVKALDFVHLEDTKVAIESSDWESRDFKSSYIPSLSIARLAQEAIEREGLSLKANANRMFKAQLKQYYGRSICAFARDTRSLNETKFELASEKVADQKIQTNHEEERETAL